MSQLVYPAQSGIQSSGNLIVRVNSALDARPVKDASIALFFSDEPENEIARLTVNETGQTEIHSLLAPSVDYSMAPSRKKPYSEYTVRIKAPGYEMLEISGAEVFPGQTAIQEVQLKPEEMEKEAVFVIPSHTLFGNYPPKIAEEEVKRKTDGEEAALTEVVIPEYIVVHDGPPSDTSARNYYVKFKEYIKNAACCEIYATWPEAAIQANVLAILSSALNRVNTEWYRNQGYNFVITSSTAFDHKWIPGRNIFGNISHIVDTVFSNYLARPDVKQPILTQYCDGNRTQCPNWMTQWGSKYLGDKGYSPIEILRYFYGDDMYIERANRISGVPAAWSGINLRKGLTGENVRTLQSFLGSMSAFYPPIPELIADGKFGSETEQAVKHFQTIFQLPSDGIVNFPTWYKIQDIYVGMNRLGQTAP